MYYVVDVKKGFVAHQGNETSCWQYIDTCLNFWGKDSVYLVAQGAKERDWVLKNKQCPNVQASVNGTCRKCKLPGICHEY